MGLLRLSRVSRALAARSKAVFLPTFVLLEPDRRMRVVFGDPIEIVDDD